MDKQNFKITANVDSAETHHPNHPVTPAFIEHAGTPYHLGEIDRPDGKAKGVGTCGDIMEIAVRLASSGDGAVVNGDRSKLVIDDIGHIPTGCAYTVACASAVCLLAKGKTPDEALQIGPEDVEKVLGGLPEDHLHCARLAVNTLGEAIAEAFRIKVLK